MPSVLFYFHAHQPFRIKWNSALTLKNLKFEDLKEITFDDEKNEEIIHKVAGKCYYPTNDLLYDLIKKHEGRFKISYSITGVLLEQLIKWAPNVLDSFKRLYDTGCMELVAETYYHSLASLYSEEEFKEQVKRQLAIFRTIFGARPKIFRNTELIYSDQIGELVADMKFDAILAEGADDILDWRSPNYIYKHPTRDLKILTKNYKLSDDIAFRFSNRSWSEFPLTADRYAEWVHRLSGSADVLNLFMDYETFGEHQWADSGIFEFLRYLPEKILAKEDWGFKTLSEALASYPVRGDLSYHRTTSWADLERDTSAWNGNRIQQRALQDVYKLEQAMRDKKDPHLLHFWRKLQTSDHFYYMCTKWFSDADVHNYFSHVKNPYEAFVMYMNSVNRLNELGPSFAG